MSACKRNVCHGHNDELRVVKCNHDDDRCLNDSDDDDDNDDGHK